MATSHPSPSVAPQPVVPPPTAEQQRLLDRIAMQRDRLRARRAARAQSLALVQREPGAGGIDESLVLRAAGFARASNFTHVSIAPSLGWVFMDNLQISGIGGVNSIDTGTNSSTVMTFLAEPSGPLPFNDKVFGFLGVGAGLGYSKDGGAGFALAPRLGLNVLVGRSGVLERVYFD